jgi:hypothetical protein
MFIEDFIALKKNPPIPSGMPLDVEYTIRQHPWVATKREVFQRRAGVVFIGTQSEAMEYIKQARTKQAIKTAERGLNPFFTR